MTQVLARKPRAAPVTNGSLRMHRFTVDEYHQMITAGILTTNHRVELLDGWIVDKMPQNPPHMTAVTRCDRWLGRVLSEEDWTVRTQGPITLATSEPEPDIVVARGPDSLYQRRHPSPLDIVQLIEVAETSLIYDREEKGLLYAAARIPHYWLVNLIAGCVECYSRPQAGRRPGYRTVKMLTRNDVLSLVLDGKNYGELAIKHLMS